jgi:hypothetical protein
MRCRKGWGASAGSAQEHRQEAQNDCVLQFGTLTYSPGDYNVSATTSESTAPPYFLQVALALKGGESWPEVCGS